MVPFYLTLPPTRASPLRFRAQSPEAPMAWDGCVERVSSEQVTHVHALMENVVSKGGKQCTSQFAVTGLPCYLSCS